MQLLLLLLELARERPVGPIEDSGKVSFGNTPLGATSRDVGMTDDLSRVDAVFSDLPTAHDAQVIPWPELGQFHEDRMSPEGS